MELFKDKEKWLKNDGNRPTANVSVNTDKLFGKKPGKKKGDPKKDFLALFGKLCMTRMRVDVWRDFIVATACSISNSLDHDHWDVREQRYMDIINKYTTEEANMFPEMFAYIALAFSESTEQDFLGEIYMQQNLANKGLCQIFTPYNVAKLMSDLTLDGDIATELTKRGYITIADECCGSGVTLIASVNAAKREMERLGFNYQDHVLVMAQDVDEIAALMCYIQLSLLGVAAVVKVGDTLSDPMARDDRRDRYWYTPMVYSPMWRLRAKAGGL